MRFATLRRQGLVAVNRLQQRQMAGGPISHNLKVKKNKFVEEWNGRREITERSFEATPEIVLSLVFYMMVLPFGVYTLVRTELKGKGDRRYEDVI